MRMYPPTTIIQTPGPTIHTTNPNSQQAQTWHQPTLQDPSVEGVSLDYLCRWQVQVFVFCVWRIPAHQRCTQCSIMLHLMDICFLTCICLWQISHIQTRLFKVVGPGLVSTSSAFMNSRTSHPVGPHGRHAPKNGKSGPHCWGRKGSTQFAQHLVSAVKAPSLVGCVVWSQITIFISNIIL